MSFIGNYWNDFLSLVYPNLCASCGKSLSSGEEIICTYCNYYLPRTNFHIERENELEKHFYGRVDLKRAASYLYFQKGNLTQHLIHQLKYKGRKDVGVKVGQLYGEELKQSVDYKGVDVIVPVPLHKSKELKRQYNQVDCFCEGLSHSLGIPWVKKGLERVRATETQTRKNRFERWQNVGTVFQISDAEKLTGRHVLLTDDVVTTGSTIEGCALALLALPGTVVSVATMAFAMKR